LLIKFDLPPGTHFRIGASPEAEITLQLQGIPRFWCILGRFHDGLFFLANLDGTVSQCIQLPAMLPMPPYNFVIFQPTAPPANSW
jgi:hypothetical protein